MAKARVETALCGILAAAPAVRALLCEGNDPPFIYWGMIPANVANQQSRFVAFRRLSDSPDNTNSGHSGMTQARFAFRCYSRASMEDAALVADAIEAELDDACASGRFTANNVVIQGLWSDGQIDDPEPPWDGGETGFPCRVVGCTVVYETTPTA